MSQKNFVPATSSLRLNPHNNASIASQMSSMPKAPGPEYISQDIVLFQDSSL